SPPAPRTMTSSARATQSLSPCVFFFSSRRRHTRSVSAFLLNRSSDLAEFTENIINGVERPVKAAELFAFTLRVRAGNTDVLTDAEENVRQKLRAEGVM